MYEENQVSKNGAPFRCKIDTEGDKVKRYKRNRKHDINSPLSPKEKGKSWEDLKETALP